jgi:hypothetical protein
MKLIKCLRKHNFSDYIGVVVDATKDIEFYTVIDIIENMPHLFSYKVLNIRAVNGKLAVGQHDTPVVVYMLGI